MRIRIVYALLSVTLTYACSHPIEIVGEGDVWSDGGRTCTLEDYQEERGNCSKNYVAEAYQETYYAVPRKGWRFHRWRNYCHNATDNTCSFDVPEEVVLLFLGAKLPPLKAIFTPINAGHTDTVFVDGKEWLQPDLFRGGLSWREINAVCPAGVCVEGGKLNGINMTGWTWATTDDVNALFNFYIGSEQLGPGPDSFSDIDEDFTTLTGWRYFYVEEEPPLQIGAWRPTLRWHTGVIYTLGLTSTPQLSLVRVLFRYNLDESPNTSVETGIEYQDDDYCGWYSGCSFVRATGVGAWFYRTP